MVNLCPVAEAEPEDLSLSLMIPGVSAAISVLQRVLVEIASTDIPVLILGESGTGKEVIASEMHRLSPQRNEPLVKFNCSKHEPGFTTGQAGCATQSTGMERGRLGRSFWMR